MNTLIIIAGCVMFGSIPLIVPVLAKNFNESNRKKKMLPLGIWIAFLICIFIAVTIAPNIAKDSVINDNCKMVATFEDGDLYYDSNNDNYFLVTISDWDIFKLVQTKSVNKSIAEEKLNKIDIINEYQEDVKTMFDKEG